MNMKTQVIVGAIGVTLAALVGLALVWYMTNSLDYSAIEQIESVQVAPNNFQDLSGTVNVKSADDVGYQIKGDMNLNILYGDLVIKVPKQAFNNEEFMRRLSKVGIEIKYRTNPDTGKIQYKVTYWGEPVECYALIN